MVEMKEKNNETTEEMSIEVEDSMDKIEEALLFCEFGRFNIKLMVASFAKALAQITSTISSSYIISSAECDLYMDSKQKGLLNAAPFFGIIATIAISGFLSSAFGRRKFLVGGSIFMGVCCILEGSSQKYWMLVLGKFLAGIGIGLVQTTSTAMIAECTHKNLRDKILVYFMSFDSLAHVVVTLLAWLILTKHWYFNIWNGYFELHSWNMFLYISSIWSWLAAVLYYSLPESPKFLLLNGQSDDAMRVIINIFKENTGKLEHSFPITSLTNSSQKKKNEIGNQMKEAMFNMRYLTRTPDINNLIFLSIISFVCFWSMSCHRLWYPQLSTIIEYYEKNNNQSAEFCPMIDRYMKFQNVMEPSGNLLDATVCVPINAANNYQLPIFNLEYEQTIYATNILLQKLSTSETYINSLIINLSSCVCLIVSAFLVDYVGQKYLMLLALLIGNACEIGLYWAETPMEIAGILSVTIGCMVTTNSLLKGIAVRAFPTSLRTLAFSIVMTISRCGSLTGNLLFPIMLEKSCVMTFGLICSGCFAVTLLIYFLPNPSRDNKGTGDK